MPTTINELPPELLRHILGQLSQGDNADALLAASLVARAWRVPAQAALWDDITLEDFDQIEDMLESSSIGRYRTTSLTVEEFDVETSNAVTELLAALVGLKNLDITYNCLVDYTSAHVGSFSDEAWIFRGYLRDLKSLQLATEFVHKARGSTTPAFALSYFFLGASTNSYRVVKSILTSSASTLTTLHLDYPSEESYKAIIRSLPLVGNTLKSLTFWTQTACGIPAAGFTPLKPALASLVVLEEFFLNVSEIGTAIMAVESLPSPVPVLEVSYEARDGSDSSAAAELLATIGGAAWSGLRRLEFSSQKEVLLKMAKGPELLHMCEERGIMVKAGWE